MYSEAQTHERAAEIIRTAWARHGAFCLYLRNFGLGARTSKPVEISPVADGHSLYDIGVDVRMEDDGFQRALMKHVAPSLCVVGLENPSYDSRHNASLPRLSLTDDSWRAVVSDLIAAAKVIIVYFDNPTPGVIDEIAMIRGAGRQGATVLVTSPHARATEDLRDFSIAMMWDEENEDPVRLVAAIDSVPPQDAHRYFAAQAPALTPPASPTTIRQEANVVINAGLALAGEEFREGKLVDMEDKVSVCVAMSYWGDIPEARAVAFLEIARGQFQRQQVVRATGNLERALDLCERLVRSDCRPASSFSDMFDDIVATVAPYLDKAKMDSLLQRIWQLRDHTQLLGQKLVR